jgi:proteasome lid subunit RPN8/RPN11
VKRLEINAELRQAIESHAESAYPLEACGFLLGTVESNGFLVKLALPAANRNQSNPRHRYEAAKEDYVRAEQACAAEGMAILGVFHSHPDAPPQPSSIDSEFAFPEWVYWISRVNEGKAVEARAWLRSQNANSWEEIAIEQNHS